MKNHIRNAFQLCLTLLVQQNLSGNNIFMFPTDL